MNISVTPLVGQYAVRNGRLFYVKKDKSCSCGEANCLHVQAVADYLRRGGVCAPVAVTPLVSCVQVEFGADDIHLVREEAMDKSGVMKPVCSCGKANCPAIVFARRICPVCGAARTDSRFCPVDGAHYHAHWVARLRAAHNGWRNRLLQDPYHAR